MQSLIRLGALAGFAATTLAAPVYAAPRAIDAQGFVRQAALPAWAVPPMRAIASTHADPVVKAIDETQIWLGSGPGTLYNRAIQINEQSSLGGIGQYALSYVPAYQRLLVHRVAILRQGVLIDHTATVDIRALEREEGLERGLYGGAKTMQMLLRDVRVGDILWVTYTIEGENPVFSGKGIGAHSWESEVPVENRRLMITHPRKRPLALAQVGDFNKAKLEPRVEQVGENTRLTFEGRALDAVETEPSTPTDYLPARVVQFSEYMSWQAVAQWASTLFKTPPPSPRVAALADSLAKGGAKLDRATAALRWVQDEVRYFSVSVGENSHRPQLPDVVLRNRYGDCKDKSALLVALLDRMGIEARPVLVSAYARRLPGKVLPSPVWFDHVIVRLTVDGRDYFVDPTRTWQAGALEQQPVAMAGAEGLLVDAGTTALLSIPEDRNRLPQIEINESITLPSFEEPAILETSRTYRGDYASWARGLVHGMAAPSLRKHALEPYEKEYPGIKLIGQPKLVDEGSQVALVVRYSVPSLAKHKDRLFSIEYKTRILEGSLGIPDKVVRNYPLAVAGANFHGRYRLKLRLPEDVRWINEPGARELDAEHFRAREDYLLRGNSLDYSLDYHVKSAVVPASAVEALQASARELEGFVGGSFRIHEGAIVGPEALSLSMRHLSPGRTEALVNARMDSLRSTAPAAISKDAFCALVSDISSLNLVGRRGEHVSMPSDEQISVILDGRPELRPCFASGLAWAGYFKRSQDHFSSSQLQDDDGANVMRAWIKLRSGDARAAALIAARYRSARKGQGQSTEFDTALEVALRRRAAMEVPDELFSEVRSFPEGPWPRPIVAMQAGLLTPGQLLSKAEAMSGDAREFALGEAQFYIAQQYLASGDKAGAEQALRWIAIHGIKTQPIFSLAKYDQEALVDDDADFDAGAKAWVLGQQPKAREYFERAALRQYSRAEYMLGTIYFSGEGVEKNVATALGWFRLAAAHGNAGAMYAVGNCYQFGWAVPADSRQALDWKRRAAELGNKDGLFYLAMAYRDGDDVPKDLSRSAQLMRDAAELGVVNAQAELARFYLYGMGVRKNYQEALYWAELAAAQGSKLAEESLGEILFEGLGIVKDEARAVKKFEKIAESDDRFVHAKFRLAQAYLEGRGVPKDLARGLSSMRQVAATYRTAEEYLADIYEAGEVVERDEVLARQYSERCAASGSRYCQYRLGNMLSSGSDGSSNMAEAVRLYSLAADQGHGPALNNLGDLYETGRGVQKDFVQAKEFYKRSAIAGTPMAFWNLATLFDKGWGVPQNASLAYIYVRLALKLCSTCANWEGRRDALASKLNAGERQDANEVVKLWKMGDALPGFGESPGINEASASPAGRE